MDINSKPQLVENKILNEIKKKHINNSLLNKLCKCLTSYLVYFIKTYYDFIIVVLLLCCILYFLRKNKKEKNIIY